MAAADLALVVGHNGHEAADRSVRVAVDLAERLGATVHVVHCVTLEDLGVDPDTEVFEEQRDRHISAERARIDGLLAETTTPWVYHEEHGDAAHRLAHVADEVDALLIVVGASHRGPVRHLLAGGSVPKHLEHRQRRPVVVVP